MSTDQSNSDALARLGVRRTQETYADIITRRAFDELSSVMTRECRLDIDLADRQMDFTGPQAIGDFISKQMERFDFFVFVILNAVTEVDVAFGRAASRMYISEQRSDHDGFPSVTYGVYHDLFVVDDGTWKLDRRRYASYARTDPDNSDKLVTFELTEIPLSQLLADDA